MFAAIHASDPHSSVPANYRGHEVIAETGATMAQLRGWIHDLKASPPRGLHKVVEQSSDGSSGIGTDRDVAVEAKFESAGGGRTVIVIAADPKRIREQLGPVFTLIDNYNAVPGMLRGPIDDQAKKQVGYSVTELLDPSSPVGAVVAQVKRMQSGRRRGILILDGSNAK